jgi:rod shape-determining protein MreC
MVTAQVIGREPENWFNNIIINKGRVAGLSANMPVVTEEGVVGVVRQVADESAVVMLVTDSKSAVGGLIADSRDYVLVEGSAERLGTAVVRPLGAEIRLKAGQEVITSGLGELFPKGLRIGRIQRVIKGRYGLSPSGVLIPSVNFSRLEEVAVIVRSKVTVGTPVIPPGEGSPSAGP